jgi:hypothetical protein
MDVISFFFASLVVTIGLGVIKAFAVGVRGDAPVLEFLHGLVTLAMIVSGCIALWVLFV